MERTLSVLSWAAAVLYVGVGLGELILAGESLGHRAEFALAMCIFAGLVLAGVRLIDGRPWLGATLASIGALAAGISIFWTVAGALLAIAIVVLSILVAHRTTKPGLTSA